MRSTAESSPDESLADEGAPHEVFIRRARAALAEGGADEEAMVRIFAHRVAAHRHHSPVPWTSSELPQQGAHASTHSLHTFLVCRSWCGQIGAPLLQTREGRSRGLSFATSDKSASHAVLLGAQAKLVDDAEAECAALVSERAAVAAQLAATEENLEVSRAQFLRLNADFDNFRKRTARPPSPEHAARAGRLAPPCAAPGKLPLPAAAPAPRRTRSNRS